MKYLIVFFISALLIAVGFFLRDELVVVNFKNTYYVFNYLTIAIALSFILLSIFAVYFLFSKFKKSHINRTNGSVPN